MRFATYNHLRVVYLRGKMGLCGMEDLKKGKQVDRQWQGGSTYGMYMYVFSHPFLFDRHLSLESSIVLI